MYSKYDPDEFDGMEKPSQSLKDPLIIHTVSSLLTPY